MQPARLSIPPVEEFIPSILKLPHGRALAREELLVDAFRLHRDQRFDVFFMPTYGQSAAARIMLVGITPGWTQMELAYRHLRIGLEAGLELGEAQRRARYVASFGGVMRGHLVAMLDGIGVNSLLGVVSSRVLFDEAQQQLHSTSILRHPVFVGEKNFTGHGDFVTNSEYASQMVREIFVPELAAMPNALVVPMGDYVSKVLDDLGNSGMDKRRCLLGFPHPSGANGHRKQQYSQNREELTRKAAAWFQISS